MNNAIEEVRLLSEYVRATANSSHNQDHSKTLMQASKWLEELSRNMCRQGYIGCEYGETCSSDHK